MWVGNVSAYGLGNDGLYNTHWSNCKWRHYVYRPLCPTLCTAGRAALITGQYPIRSGMTTVGRPAALGLKAGSFHMKFWRKTTLQDNLVKSFRCDRKWTFPTVHGFDEFYGNPFIWIHKKNQQKDYPQDPEIFQKIRNPWGITLGQPTKTTQR
jgi:arylsulfatase